MQPRVAPGAHFCVARRVVASNHPTGLPGLFPAPGFARGLRHRSPKRKRALNNGSPSLALRAESNRAGAQTETRFQAAGQAAPSEASLDVACNTSPGLRSVRPSGSGCGESAIVDRGILPRCGLLRRPNRAGAAQRFTTARLPLVCASYFGRRRVVWHTACIRSLPTCPAYRRAGLRTSNNT